MARTQTNSTPDLPPLRLAQQLSSMIYKTAQEPAVRSEFTAQREVLYELQLFILIYLAPD